MTSPSAWNRPSGPLPTKARAEDDVRAEYRKIAERRVRLGLLLGEIGSEAKVDVTQDELRNALFAEARRFPGQEKMVYEYFQNTPGAIAQLRAPLFEDKVVDYIAGKAKITDKKVPKDELLKPFEDDDATGVAAPSTEPTPGA